MTPLGAPHFRYLLTALAAAAVLGLGLGILLGAATLRAMAPLPLSLGGSAAPHERAGVTDRRGAVLAVTRADPHASDDAIPLHRVPPLLRRAFVEAEDRNFYAHGGVDWAARAAAFAQNLRARRVVRGASTITEQVARLLHPRPRSIWGRWVGGFEAQRLERGFTKDELLEYYITHVPYPRRRLGVVQAARDLFDRDLETLRPRELLALAVMVRAPARLDPRVAPRALDRAVNRLTERLRQIGAIDAAEYAAILAEPLELRAGREPIEAAHFVAYVRETIEPQRRTTGTLRSTLDAGLQQRAQALLAAQLARLSRQGAGRGALLVIDHQSDQVLAWVNSGSWSSGEPGSQIDAVRARRQPGSALKPFLYAAALERGAHAAVLIDDAPLSASIGQGLHRFRNYSRSFHGRLRLRETLGNSLNLPAVRVLRDVTPPSFLATLHELGFASLDRPADHYGDGLALGSGEVSLHELVQAYAVLARGGVWRPLRVAFEPAAVKGGRARRVFTAETSSIIADILADPAARRLEFGEGGLLEFPRATAVKTGTSTDYRDAWALGFSSRHVVGAWLGNLDGRSMEGVSGSIGPALVVRAVFAELDRDGGGGPLYIDPRLRRLAVCSVSGGSPGTDCPTIDEWFRPRDLPLAACTHHANRTAARADALSVANGSPRAARLTQPTPGLRLAVDPRIPDALEAFALEVDTPVPPAAVEWLINGAAVARTGEGQRSWLWPLKRGAHTAQARVWLTPDHEPTETPAVAFRVE